MVRGAASEYSCGDEASEWMTFSIVEGVGEDMRGKSMSLFPVSTHLIGVATLGHLFSLWALSNVR